MLRETTRNVIRFVCSFCTTLYWDVRLKVDYTKKQTLVTAKKVARGICKIWGTVSIPFKLLVKDIRFLTKGFGGLFRLFFLVLAIGIFVYVKFYSEAVVITITGMIETFITAVYFRQKDKEDKKSNNQNKKH